MSPMVRILAITKEKRNCRQKAWIGVADGKHAGSSTPAHLALVKERRWVLLQNAASSGRANRHAGNRKTFRSAFRLGAA